MEEIAIDYSDCSSAPLLPQTAPIPSSQVTSNFKSKNQTSPPTWSKHSVQVHYPNESVPIETRSIVDTTVCRLYFEIPNDIGPPVFLYYRLTDFYQNHRRYVKSFDQQQLQGDFRDNNSISNSDCDPLRIDPETQKPFYPCGLIANSIFNDTIRPPVLAGSNAGDAEYAMTDQGIAWSSDKDLYKVTNYTEDQVVPPPNWRLQYPSYNDTFPLPNIHTWEAFQVWMRTAGLPTFSKLALRNDTATMRSGSYYVEVNDCKILDLELVNDKMLMNDRFSRDPLWRNKVYTHLYQNRHWRKESVFGHRLRCCCWHLRLIGRSLHSNTLN